MSGSEILLNIAGGVALLLWAIRMIRTGIMRAYGADLRRFLGWSTKNRFTSFLMGIASSGLLQSSSATGLLAVSFASRGLITTGAALALMLGADLGSTVVVQVLSLKITWLSPLLVLIGVLLFLTSEAPIRRHLGRVFIGLGLLFLSLTLIVSATEGLRDSETLKMVISALAYDPILGVLLAIVLTWVMHSSVALVILVMSLALGGALPVSLAFALVLGANVGSALIPLALTMKATPPARRIPIGNLIFRVSGMLMMLPFISALVPFADLLGDDVARQVANFHTLFNLTLALIFLPLIALVVKATEMIVPDRADLGNEVEGGARYLDERAQERPQIALSCATRETLRMADSVEVMLRRCVDAFDPNSKLNTDEISVIGEEVDRVNEDIKFFITQISRDDLSSKDLTRLDQVLAYATNLEQVADIIDTSLLPVARRKGKKKLSFSKEGWREICDLHAAVLDTMQLSLSVFMSNDIGEARRLIAAKAHFRALDLEANANHLDRLRNRRVESIETSALHLDILRDLKRINSHLAAVAYQRLEEEGALRPSRLIDPESAKEADENLKQKSDNAHVAES
jgi:phosphate:Na+ symporter